MDKQTFFKKFHDMEKRLERLEIEEQEREEDLDNILNNIMIRLEDIESVLHINGSHLPNAEGDGSNFYAGSATKPNFSEVDFQLPEGVSIDEFVDKINGQAENLDKEIKETVTRINKHRNRLK